MDFKTYSEFTPELKEKWNLLLEKSASHAPFLRFEYLDEWWQTRGGGEWPVESRLLILCAYEGQEIVGIAPFFIVEHEGQKRMLLLGSIEISDFLDLIVPSQRLQDFIPALLKHLSDEVLTEGVKTVDLYNLLEDSPSLPILLAAAPQAGFEVTQTRLQQAPYIPLPGDWEEYLNQIDKKQRHEIRRKMRRATEGEVTVEVYFTTEPDRVEEDGEAFMALMAQDPEKKAFLTPAMRDQFGRSIQRAFACGCLQLAFLKIGGEDAAAYLSFDYQNRIWVYNSGLDRRFMAYSPGWVLLGHLLQWANENGRSEFDFMRGNEEYKYKFGAVDRYVTRLELKKK